jgi:hypothetical protein
MIASTKALSLVLFVTAITKNISYGFCLHSLLTTKSQNYYCHHTSNSRLSMLENSAEYSFIASGSSSGNSDVPNIAPPPIMFPPQPEEQNAFFASPSDDSSMDMDISSSSSSSSQPAVALASTITTSTTTSSLSKKMAKFQSDGGIMMECNRPYPSAHPVTALALGQKKAGFKPEGIMMAATSSVPKPKKSKSSSPPKESSSMQPNTSSFRWKPAAVTPNGKLQWRQREIDCMPMPAE